ncbi:Ig-like domain-containing protein [Pedobacter cryoconitis]|uniref:Putative repeat protein (TIGR01451 family)/gliding motility-associated-like protein n=1 Tax=Pedobacter cryoconitis TaxID=188932 RepID=A0A7X0J431_9SPHI|nr:gliding motility-associated C-terminal domain-containing protein [Pedobacter cryoconitis]MBB6500680.1 putative repeat protein (TIGR01451 family)/gliding motility-associated-like protein [Pedobacter cryoconitis]
MKLIYNLTLSSSLFKTRNTPVDQPQSRNNSMCIDSYGEGSEDTQSKREISFHSKFQRACFFLLFLFISLQANAQFTITQSFMGSSVTGITIGGNATLTSGGVDPTNQGWLRLTPAALTQAGYAYINQSFPSTLGVLADFEYKTWRPTNPTFGGADGIGVFLFDASVPFKLGANGGSLGYAPSTSSGITGLGGGYIGLGLDEFGNYSSPNDGRNGGPGQVPNSVVLRGPTTTNAATTNTYLAGLDVNATFGLPIGYGTLIATRPTDAQFYRRVQVQIVPTGVPNTYMVTVNWTTTPNGAFTQLFQYTLTTLTPVPANLKIGFASSTGGGYNNHEIRNLIVTTPGGVRVLKSVDKLTANVGDQLTYTVNATNQTPAYLQGLTFTDALSQFPPGFQVTSVTFNNNGNALNTATGYSNTNLSNIAVNLDANSTGTFTIVGKINSYPSGGTISNTATFNVGTSGITDPDLTNNTATVSTTVLQNDLSITKTVNNATPRVNSNVAFTVKVLNNGPLTGNNITVNDLLPAGYTYISSTPSVGTYNSATGVWSVGSLTNGANATLVINATVLGTGPYANTATVTAAEYDPVPANNTATNTPVPIAPYDLAVVKTATPATAVAGSPLTYTINLTNNGPSPILATDVINVTDNLPAGFTASSYVAAPAGTTYNSSNGNWTGLTLASGQSATLTITGTVSATATGALSNTATVSTPPGITDPVPGNNTSTISTNISRVLDLGVTKTSNPTTVIAGQTLTYTITLTNNGPTSLLATDVVPVVDNLPAGFTATSYTAANGTYTSSNGNWTGLTLASGQSTTLTIVGTTSPSAAGTLSNTVTLTPPTGTTDPTPGNNTATTPTTVSRQIDFSLTKSASPKPAIAGQTLTYTLTLKNNGISSLLASDIVSVVDNLPAGFTASSYTPSAGTYTSSNGNWTGLTLANGQSATLVIAGTVNASAAAGNLTNTATVTPPTGITDPTPGNNTGTDVTAVTRSMDLGVSKTASPNPAVTGQALTYTITLTNSGPSALVAADVIQVVDNLPAGFTASTYTPATGTYTSSNGNWTGLTLASGQSTTLTIAGTVAANATGSLSNTVSVVVPAGVTDPTPGNNTATITTPVSRVIDLGVTKTSVPKPPVAGQTVTYTITLSNNGPGTLLAADVVTLTDNLPAGFTASSFVPSAGTYTSSNGNWTGLTLTSGQTATLTITGTVAPTASGSLSNTVTVAPPTGVTDPTPGNNTATDVGTISRVIDFGVVKTASPTTATAGNALTYTITLTNNGPSTLAAADVLTLTDNLPAGFNNPVYSPAAGTYTSANGNWTGLTLASGQSTTLTITGTVAPGATGTLTNTATVTSPPGITDPTPGNNTSTVITNITSKPVLTITKLGAAGLTAGNVASYTLNIANTGSSNAVGASITDIVPAALTNVSWTSTVAGAAAITTGATGTGNNVSLTANIPAGAANTISVTITGTVNPGATGSISNTATVTPAEPAGTGSNSTVNSNITSTSGVVVTKTGPSTATAGNQITYQVAISNNGPSNATGVQIADAVPATLSNVSWTTQVVGTAAVTTGATGTGNNVNVTANVPAGTSNKVLVVITGTIDPAFAGNITNNAIATPQEPGSTPVNAQAVTTVTKVPAFTITKSGQATALAGNTIVYTITAKNNGPSNSVNTVLTDAVPAAITGVSWTATTTAGTALINSGATGTGNAINVNANFATGSTIQIVVSGTIASNASGTLTNTATATPAEPGTTPVTSTAVNTTITAQSGLTIVKSVTPVINSGNNVTYTVTVGNNGPSDAIAAHVQDAIPASILNTTWTSVVQGAATITSGATGTGNTLDARANIPAGAANKIIFTITGKSDPALNGTISNTASVTATEPNSPSPSSTVNTIASRTPVVSITKNGPAAINAGETITYTLNVTNTSASDALNLAIADAVPATITGVNWTATTAGNAQVTGALTGTGNTISINGNVAAGTGNQITITVTGKVAAGFSGTLTNTATVTPAETGTSPASATATTNVTRIPVLSIQKNGPASLSAGQAITYTIAVKNISQANAIASVITDAIPASILNPSWTTTTSGTATVTAGATGTGNNLSVTGNIGGNSTDQILITITGTVNPAATANISNSATVTPAETGAVPQTAGPVITTITKTPSVSLTKMGPTTANAGETVTYVLNAVNNGPSNATALVITDAVPAALTNVTWTAAASGTSSVVTGTGTGNNISVTGNLNVGNTNNIQITVTGQLGSAQANTVITNTATATPSEPGISPVNSNTVNTTVGNKSALIISKTGPATVDAGGNVVYNLTISNNGPSNALAAVITDQVAAALTNVTWTATVTGTATVTSTSGTGNAVSVTGSIPAGAANHVNVMITGTLNPAFSGTSISNAATVTPSEPGNNPVTSNTVTTGVTKTSNLVILKSGPSTAVAGQPVTYTIQVSNSGPSDVTGARVQDVIPTSILGPSWTVTASGSAGANLLSGSGNVDLLANLKANGQDALTITITGTLDPLFNANASITNTASITPPAGVTNPTPVTSTVTTTTSASANVRIVKSGPANVGAGEMIQYELSISNAGPSTAVGTVIVDNLPAGVLNPTWTVTTSGGATASVPNGNGNVNLTANIPSGTGLVTVMVSGNVDPALADGTSMPNTATANSTVPDPQTSNNTAVLPTTISNNPDFRVSKSGPATANVGDPISYRIIVTNSGLGNITGASINDIVPADVSVTNWTATALYASKIAGIPNNVVTGTTNTISIPSADIDAGSSNAIEIIVNGTVLPSAGASFTNTVTVVAGATHSSSVVTSVNKSTDLRVEKQGPQSVAAGDHISYTLKVFNNGTVDATGLTINDVVPASVTVNNWTATVVGTATITSGTSGNSNTVQTIGNIPGGDNSNYILITINGTVPSNTVASPIINNASLVLPAGLADYNLANNTATVTTTVTNNPTLQVSKSGPQTAVAGQQVHYVIQVSNNGPSDATAVNITDPLPAQLINYTWTATSSGTAAITSTPTTGTTNPVVTANIPQGAGNIITINVTGTVDPAFTGTMTNTASAQIGVNPAVTSPTVNTVVSKVTAISIRKSGPASTSPGLPITYTLEVTNAGPSNATAAAITDAIPAILQNVSWTASAQNGAAITTGATGTGNALNVVANIPGAVNARVLITITGTIPSSATADIVNTATVTPTEPGNPPVNSNQVTTALTRTPGLVLVKSGPATAASGQQITYTLNLSNAGPSDAVNTAISDLVPAAVQNVTWTTTATGAAVVNSGATGTGNQMTANVNVPVGAAITVTITGTIDPTFNNTLTNQAVATPSEPGITPVTSTVSTVVKPVVNLSITKSGPATLLAGQEIDYQITVINSGPSTALNAAISDLVQADIINVQWTALTTGNAVLTGASSGNSNTIATNANLTTAPGDALIIQVKGTVNPAFNGTLTNTATVTPTETGSTPTTTVPVVTVVSRKPVINIVKTGPANVVAGAAINYLITVNNQGTGDAIGLAISDVIPAQLTGINWTATTTGTATLSGTTSGTTSNIALTGNIPAGAGNIITINVSGIVPANLNTSITNTATATPAEAGVTPVSSSVTTTVSRVPILNITKSGPANATAGTTVQYIITTVNTSTSDAIAAVITDAVPAGLTGVSWTATAAGTATVTSGTTGTGNNVSVTANIPAGNANTITIVVTGSLPAGTTAAIQNTATVTPAEPGTVPQTTPPVNTTVEAVTDLSVTNTVNQALQKVGQPVTFTVQVKNNGPSNATGVKVTDLLPAGYQITSQSATTGTYDPASGLWTIGNLANGGTTTLTIQATLIVGGPYQTTAVVSGNETDPFLTNNTAIATVSVVNSDPVANPDTNTLLEDQTLIVTAANGVLANDTDVDNNTLSVSKFTIAGIAGDQTPGNPVLIAGVGTITLGSDGGYTFVPAQDYNGPVPVITYTVIDGQGGSATSTLTLTVIPVNDAPSFVKGADQTVLQYAGAQTIPGWATAISPGPANESSQLVNFIVTNANNALFTTQPAIAPDGTLTYTPAFGATGTVTVTVILKDNGGTANGGVDQSAPQTFTITITPGTPAMTLTKVANNTGTKAGDVITYTIVATNTGNVTLSNIVVADPGADAGSITPANIVTLAPGASATVTAKHTLTQADIDGGKFSNQASAKGTDPSGNPVDKPKSDDPNTPTPDDATVVVITPVTSMTLTKVANNTGSKAGDVITYTIVATNTGNVTLSNIVVADPGADAGSITPANIVTLAPGASSTVTAKHTLTQGDLDGGTYSNQASAKGTDPSGNPVDKPKSDDPNTPTPDDATVIVLTPKPAVTLVKTGVISTDNNSITYTFVVQNTGNVTFTTVLLNDAKLGVTNLPVNVGTGLTPGASVTVTQVYTLTQADKNAGNVTNTANVKATAAGGATATDISGTDATNDTPTVVAITPSGGLSLVKTGVFSGNQITYTFTVQNLGNVTLNPVTFSDAKLGIVNRTIDVGGGLLPGASASITQLYTLTQADKDAGKVTNTAIAKAITPSGATVTAVSGTDATNTNPTVIVVTKSPVANDDQAQTNANSPVRVDVLANDNPGSSSFDKATVVVITQPAHGKVIVNSDGTITYTPDPGYTGPDNFTYQVRDMYGYLTNVANVAITVSFFEIKIPNLFTPNGDGRNDTFEIRGLDQYGDNELSIVNRWGNEVFRQNNYQNTWTGEGLNEGTYYYLLKVKAKGGNGDWQIFKGYITLIRAFKK